MNKPFKMTSSDKYPTFFNQESLTLFNLFLRLNNDNDDDKKNCLFDVPSIIRGLYALAIGVRSDKVRNVIKLYEELPQSTYARSGVFLRSNLQFQSSYIDFMLNKNFYVASIPVDYNGIKTINKHINEKFPNWPNKNKKFLENPLTSNIRLYIKDESIFSAEWREYFDTINMEKFYIGDNKNIMVPMMVKEHYFEYMYTFDDAVNNIKWVSMNYSENESMLIIMPNEARTYKELVAFCNNDLTANDISQFYEKNRKMLPYSTKKMPEFQFKSKWALSNDMLLLDQEEIDYVSTLFDPNLDMRNMCENLGPDVTCNTLLNSISKIHNNQYGTHIETVTEIYQDDCDNDEEHTLVIDKSFIFMILDKNKKIGQIGIYAG